MNSAERTHEGRQGRGVQEGSAGSGREAGRRAGAEHLAGLLEEARETPQGEARKVGRLALKELRRIRAALERPTPEPVAVDYATAAKMLCTSKRSIERMVAEERLKPIDLAGPKIPVMQLRALVDGRVRTTRRAQQKPQRAAESRAQLRELVSSSPEGQGD
jgi:hypothetical protein